MCMRRGKGREKWRQDIHVDDRTPVRITNALVCRNYIVEEILFIITSVNAHSKSVPANNTKD